MVLKVKKLNKDAILPTRGSSSAAGWDLYALHGVTIKGGETVFIQTGLAMQIPEGYFGAIYARSGLASNQGLRPANCVGVIDSDYRGEIVVALHNDNYTVIEDLEPVTAVHYGQPAVKIDTDSSKYIDQGERIAQLVIQKYEEVEIEEVHELDNTARGEGGFGSTGTN